MGGIIVKILQNKKQFLFFYMLGFFVGIIFANLCIAKINILDSVFNDYFLQQYKDIEVITEEYIFYLVRARIIPFIILFVLSLTVLRKMSVIASIVWTGFASGLVLSTAVICRGIKGILLCIISLFPHILFYLPAYIVLMWYSYTYPKTKWSVSKTTFAIVVLFLGIITELYINPILLESFVKRI